MLNKKNLVDLYSICMIFGLCIPNSGIAADLKPPGNCSAKQHASLQSAVDSNCSKPKMSCSNSDSTATKKATANVIQKCINSRVLINDTCFNGGDAGHKKQVEDRKAALKTCQ